MQNTQTNITVFLAGYIACALWTSEEQYDSEGHPVESRKMYNDDLAPETLERMEADCQSFIEKAGELIEGRHDQAGHDFWLTRNGHGSGFWDFGRWPEGVGDTLTDLSKSFGECDLYWGDDGLIYGEWSCPAMQRASEIRVGEKACVSSGRYTFNVSTILKINRVSIRVRHDNGREETVAKSKVSTWYN
jgi:hypothetical protein